MFSLSSCLFTQSPLCGTSLFHSNHTSGVRKVALSVLSTCFPVLTETDIYFRIHEFPIIYFEQSRNKLISGNKLQIVINSFNLSLSKESYNFFNNLLFHIYNSCLKNLHDIFTKYCVTGKRDFCGLVSTHPEIP